MDPVTAWAGRVEILPTLPAFGYSTKLCNLDPADQWLVGIWETVFLAAAMFVTLHALDIFAIAAVRGHIVG